MKSSLACSEMEDSDMKRDEEEDLDCSEDDGWDLKSDEDLKDSIKSLSMSFFGYHFWSCCYS